MTSHRIFRFILRLVYRGLLSFIFSGVIFAAETAPPSGSSPLRREFPPRSSSVKPPVTTLLPQGVPMPTDKVNIRESTFNGFVHPGIGLTKEMLEAARSQLLAGKEPWLSGYIQMTRHGYSGRDVRARNESTKRPGEPDTDALINEGVHARLMVDGERAQQQALMYYFTGDEIYRANALRILRVWSKMNPAKYRGDYHINAGWAIRTMVEGAEILRSTDCENPSLVWTVDDTSRLKRNLLDPMIRDSMSKNTYFMNQNNFALMGAMAAYIFTSDRQGYDARVEWFTVNSTAENQGMSGAIKQLARLVTKNDETGETIAKPIVQLAEMGRDQAHSAEDINLFIAISNLMQAQGTKVDTVAGTVSTAPNAVVPYEFLNDRILAAADYFCRFMLGYDTPWTPIAYNIDKQGKIVRFYPRLADQYRGRMTTFHFWDLYFYYTYQRKLDLEKIAPYLNLAYKKRIVEIDWLRLPLAVEKEGKALVLPPQIPDVVEVDRLTTLQDPAAVVVSEGKDTFVRITTKSQPVKITLLSADTDQKLISLRVRTTAPARLEISGLSKPWIIPDTQGRWLFTSYTIADLDRLMNMAVIKIHSYPGKIIEIDQLLQKPEQNQISPSFKIKPTNNSLVTFMGASLSLDFSVTPSGKSKPLYQLIQAPPGAVLNPQTGIFTWTPAASGDYIFFAQALANDTAAARIVRINVAENRAAAVSQITQLLKPNTPYVKATLDAFQAELRKTNAIIEKSTAPDFATQLVQLHQAANSLELLSPQLPDGTLNFPSCTSSPELKQKLSCLTDGNSDTFAEFTAAKNGAFNFDFGPGFQFTADSFDLLGRLNFESRAEGAALLGSNDGKTWTRLTPTPMPQSFDLFHLEVPAELRKKVFRYLRLQKTTGGIFEMSELHIHGQRIQASH